MMNKFRSTGCFIFLALALSVHAQGTAFTYQGLLTDGVSPANGSYDLTFTLFGVSSGGSAIAGPKTNSATSVSNGVFTVILDFGASFPGADRWLDIGVRTNGANSFLTLAPRQQVTAAPYALTAGTANTVLGVTVQQNSSGAPNMIGGSPANYISNDVIGATIAGGGATNISGNSYSNRITANFGTISGGYLNVVSNYNGTVGGGFLNAVGGDTATVGGGEKNTASGADSVVGGGFGNIANGPNATIGGGSGNTASGNSAVVAGGRINNATANSAAVLGGEDNVASGEDSTVAGGYFNTASGANSFAAGYLAQAVHQGSFVWSDYQLTPFASTAVNQFSVRASGGIRLAGDVALSGGNAYHNLSMSGGNSIGYLYGSYPAFADGIHLSYNYYADSSGNKHVFAAAGATSRVTVGYGFVGIYVGAANTKPNTQRLYADETHIEVNGTFNNNSDRNTKRDFAPVSSSQILDQVLRLPLSAWSYKDDPTTRHIGPMAQDFHEVFQIGTDDRHIAPIDEGGLAFGAIQGLNAKVENSTDRIQQLETENIELKRHNESLETRLYALERMIRTQDSN